MNNTVISRDEDQFKESTQTLIWKQNLSTQISTPGSCLTEMQLVFYPEDCKKPIKWYA